jgi:hypothetical protein
MRAPRRFAPALVVVGSGAVAAAGLWLSAAWLVPAPLAGPIGDGTANGRVRAAFTTRGFHRPEVDAGTTRQFSWTGAHAEIRIPNIDRNRPYRITLRILAGRGPATAPPPALVISVDGAPRLRAPSSNERRSYEVEAPPARRTTLVLAIDVSGTFVPGPNDRRALGVVVEDVSIEPIGASWRPTAGVLARLALATMALASVVAVCGFRVAWTIAIVALAAGANVWLLARDGAFLGPYVDRLLAIGLGATVAGALVAAARLRWPAPVHAPDWSLAAGLTIVAAAAKIAFFAHPNVALADSIFQVHRAQNVVGGQYFFTSITPRPFFEFPYAIALYVTALPFWSWFPTELDRVRLLRGISIIADACIGFAMYLALHRAWPAHRSGLIFAALWPFARAPVNALCTSNLTNLYGQGLFGVAMAIVLWMAAARRVSFGALSATLVLLSAAFLSHFSTISVGVPMAAAIGALLAVAGGRETRRLGAAIVALVVLAGAIAYGAYYSHFHDVYRATINRVVSGEGGGEDRSMAAPPRVKFDRWQRMTHTEFGWPAMAGALGGVLVLARHARHPGTIVLGGWLLGWLAFAVVGILTPIEMRANLASAPLVLALAAIAAGRLVAASRPATAAAAALALAIIWDGFTRWTHCLTG